MKTLALTLAGAWAFASAASGQTDASSDLVPFSSSVEYRGVINAVTSEIVASRNANLLGTLGEPIYANTANSGFFYDSIDGRKLTDQGRLPLPSSPDLIGTQESYRLSSLRLFYVTNATDPSLGGTGHAVEITLVESNGTCVSPDVSEAPLATFALAGLPASRTGKLAGIAVDVDISQLNICMRGEGRSGASGADGGRFSWSLRFTDVGDATSVGPYIMGDPDAVPAGDGTVFQNPSNNGTGLGSADNFLREGGPSSGCLFFGGYPTNSYASFGIVLRSDLGGDCIGCGIGDDRFEENDQASTAQALEIRAYPALISDREDDWFTLDVEAGKTIRVDVLFSNSAGDIDVGLFDAGGGTIATGVSVSDNESVTYTNCSSVVETVTLGVFATGAACSAYDLILADASAPMDDALEDNDSCATAVSLPLGLTRGLMILRSPCAGVADLDYYSIELADGETLDVDILFSDETADLDLYAYNTAIGCDGSQDKPQSLSAGVTSTDNESVVVTNSTGGALSIAIKVDLFDGDSVVYDMIAQVGPIPTVGEVICAGNDNSVGNGARLSGSGSDLAADNMLSLDVSNAPALQFGLFVASQDVFNLDPAGSQGTLCIASLVLARFNSALQMTDAQGATSFSPDITAIPFESGGMPAPLAVMTGDTVNFQFWHRDLFEQMPTSNFSDALSVTFR